MAFLYKYSTLNYEKQQRKLWLVLAVLVPLCYTVQEARGSVDTLGNSNSADSNGTRRRCLGNHTRAALYPCSGEYEIWT